MSAEGQHLNIGDTPHHSSSNKPNAQESLIPSRKCVLVEFPGYVAGDNLSTSAWKVEPVKALSTFGGGEGLGKALAVPGSLT